MAEDVPFVISAIDRTGEAFKSVEAGLGSMKDKLFGWQEAVLAAVGIGGLGELVKNAFESGDALGKMSDRIGISTESLAAFNLMASKSGVDQEQMNTALEKMEKSLGDAERGTGKASAMLKDMGLNVQELIHMPADKQFEAISAKIAEMGTQAEKTSAATAIFGKSSYELLNILQTGASGLEDARKKTEEFGTAITRVDANKLEQANEAMIDVKEAIKGIANSIAIELAPYLKAVAEYFTDAAAKGGGFRDTAKSAVEDVAKAVGFLADVFHSLGVVWAGMEVVFDSVAQAIVQVFESLNVTVKTSILGWEELINLFIEKINSVAGTKWPEIDTSQLKASIDDANSFVDEMKKRTSDAVDNLQKKLNEPMPSDGIQAYFDKVKTESQKEAEAVAASHNKMMQKISEDTGNAVSDKDKAKLQKALEEIEKVERSAIQEENFIFQQRRDNLDKALAAGMIDQTRYNHDVEALTAQHEKKLTDLAKQGALDREKFMVLSYKDQTKMVLGELENMTNGVAQSNRTMFEINKVASIANAVINTFQGFTMALATYPPPISWVMAAVTLAAGLAQVAAIQSTDFGSGTTPSAAATGPTYNGQPVYQQQTISPGGGPQTQTGQSSQQAGTTIIINDHKTINAPGANPTSEANIRAIARQETAALANHVNELVSRGAIPG